MRAINLILQPAAWVLLLSVVAIGASAQPAPKGTDKVIVSGVVPDEVTRMAILDRVRQLYGAQRVVDQLGIDRLATPPNWLQHVQSVLGPELKQVTQGQLRIRGNVVEITGNVDSEAVRTQLLGKIAAQLNNPTYTVRDSLRIGVPTQQLLDTALAQRTIEFELGNATLTTAGAHVLDELLPILRQFPGRRFEIIGHTDDTGSHDTNVQLSAMRASAVKSYLAARGIPAADIITLGVGPDRPVTPNTTPQGRSRNRRIEFRVLA